MKYINFSDLKPIDILKFVDHIDCQLENTLLIPMAFDIECTNDVDTQAAYMYIWQFAIRDFVIFGRTYEEFIELNKMLIFALQLREETNKIVVFIHNASYEWQFVRKHLSKVFKLKPFFIDSRQPVYFGLGYVEGEVLIEYRDSYMLSQCGLKKTAETYCKTQKLPDFDYDIQRNHLTELTERELEYCANDVLILTEYYKYYIDNVIIPNNFFPITQTQLPRNEVKKNWKLWKKGNKDRKKFVSRIYPKSKKEYDRDMNYLFRGGYTHANAENANIVIRGKILHIDFTSSYPAVLLHCYYPISAFKRVDYKEEYLDKYCCKLLVEFKDIEAKSAITYDSISKAVYKSDDCLDDNGRLFSAKKYTAYLTELDFKIYQKIYNYKSYNVIRCEIAERGKLPNYLIDTIIYYYSEKSKIKKYGEPKGKDKIRYEYCKRMVNSLYGMMCTKINVMDLNYVDDTYIQQVSDINWYRIKETAYLSPNWGIWCTAHARYNELDLIYKLIEINKTEWYYYSDTDSHFCKDTEYIRNYIKEYNEKISELNKEYGELLDDIGEFDLEHSPEKNPIYAFKTLGAKRYLIQTDKAYEATIAGLPKKYTDKEGKSHNLFEYFGNVMKKEPFELFENGMLLDETISCKKANYYNDEKSTAIINGVEETSLSSVFIYPITFKLFMTMRYLDQINTSQSIKEKRIQG